MQALRPGVSGRAYSDRTGILPRAPDHLAAKRIQLVVTDYSPPESVTEDLRALSAGQDSYDFEFTTTAIDSLGSAPVDHGGRVTSAAIDAGEFRSVVEFPQGREKR